MSADRGTATSHGDNHPAALAEHYIRNAAQIAMGLNADGPTEDTARIVHLLAEASANVAALVVLLERQGRTIEEMRVENVRLARTNQRLEATDTENKTRLAAAHRTVEQLVADMAELIDRTATLYNRARSITLSHDAPARPHSVTAIEPLRAVGADRS